MTHFLLNSLYQTEKLQSWQIPKTTVFGTFEWYKSLKVSQQKAIYILWDFLKCWQSCKNVPQYAANYVSIDKETFEWLFSQLILRKSDIQTEMHIEIVISFKPLMEGQYEDSFTINAEINETPVSLTFATA